MRNAHAKRQQLMMILGKVNEVRRIPSEALGKGLGALGTLLHQGKSALAYMIVQRTVESLYRRVESTWYCA